MRINLTGMTERELLIAAAKGLEFERLEIMGRIHEIKERIATGESSGIPQIENLVSPRVMPASKQSTTIAIKRRMSAAAKARISAAQKKRWRKFHRDQQKKAA